MIHLVTCATKLYRYMKVLQEQDHIIKFYCSNLVPGTSITDHATVDQSQRLTYLDEELALEKCRHLFQLFHKLFLSYIRKILHLYQLRWRPPPQRTVPGPDPVPSYWLQLADRHYAAHRTGLSITLFIKASRDEIQGTRHTVLNCNYHFARNLPLSFYYRCWATKQEWRC